MGLDHELSQFYRFLRGCLEELINCYATPERIMDECEWAQFVYASLSREEFLEGRAWVEGAALAKEKKRGEARKKVAVVLAHELSKKLNPSQRRPLQERQALLQRMRSGWVSVEQLAGLNLSQIEACQTLLKRGCSCEKSCRKVNFTRDWSDIGRCCQRRLAELKGSHP